MSGQPTVSVRLRLVAYTLGMPLALLTGSALAQAPTPTQQCAAAASGAEIEVCLKLAADHPEAVTGIAAALQAHVARASDSDRALLDAVLALADDPTAPAAAARLAELADPRALPSLVACGIRRDGEARRACVHALAAWPESLATFSAWLTDRDADTGLRIAAGEALGEQGTPAAADVLVRAVRTPRQPADLRRALSAVVRVHFPDRVPELEDAVVADGRWWLAFGGAAGFGSAMSAAGELGQANLATVGWLTGTLSGGAAGLIYGRARPMEAGDAAFLTTSGLIGIGAGTLLFVPLGQDGRVYGRLGGTALGFGAGALLHPHHPGTGRDAVEVLAVTAAATVTAAGVVADVGVPEGAAASIIGGTVLATGIVTQAVSPHVDVTREDAGLTALTSAVAFSGAMLWPSPVRNGPGRVLIGLGAGPVLGYALAHPLDPGADVQFGAWAGGVYGAALGFGVGLAAAPASPDVRLARGGALGGLALGATIGGWRAAADPEPIDPDDIALVGITTGWTAWQAAGWGAVAGADTGTAGVLVAVPAACGGGMALAATAIDLPASESLAGSSLGLWGSYAGWVGGTLAGTDPLAGALVGGNVGLATGALLVSPVVGVPPVVLGMADAGGALVGSVAALGTALATSDRDPLLVASVAGAGVGAAAGSAVAARWVAQGRTRDVAVHPPLAPPGRWTLAPLTVHVDGVPHHGAALRVEGW